MKLRKQNHVFGVGRTVSDVPILDRLLKLSKFDNLKNEIF